MTQHDEFDTTKQALMRLAQTPDANPLRRESARRLFLEEAARLRARVPARLRPHAPALRWIRLAVAIVAAVGLALAGATGAALAADDARPGDLLYPLDRGIERLQLWLAPDPEARAARLMEMADERLQEAEALAAQGDEEHMNAALDAYRQAVSTISQAVEDDKGSGKAGLLGQLEEALTAQEQRLEAIRLRVPEAAQPGIDRAIDAARRGHHGRPTGEPSPQAEPTEEPPGDHPGRPEKTPGPPDDRPHGPPDDHPHGSGQGQGEDHGNGNSQGGHKDR